MDYTVLDELMKAKKGKSSKEKKHAYEQQLLELLKEEGLSQKAETYIKNGFSFSGAAPVMKYLDSISIQEEKRNKYLRLLDSRMFRENERGIAFKMALNMLAIELKKDDPDENLVEKLIRIIPIKAVGKEGEQLKESTKIIEKYFLRELIGQDLKKGLFSFNIERGYITAFRNLIVSDIETTNTFKTLTDGEKKQLLLWLEVNKDDNTINKQEIETESEEKDVESEIVGSTHAEEVVNECSIDSIIGQLVLFKERYEKIKDREIEHEKTIVKNRSIIDYLQNENDRKKHIIGNLNEKLEEQNKAANRLEFEILQLRNQLEQQRVENESLKTEVIRMDTVNSVYAADKESSKNEQLNAIASKLKAEFLDFKDAENMEMNLDLGENFRCQLQSVFRILKKEGIDVEGRQ